jgi:uncharacterized protein DUF547
MRKSYSSPLGFLLAFVVLTPPPLAESSLRRVDPRPSDFVLKKFVNDQHQVDYSRLEKDGRGRLEDYIRNLGQPSAQPLSANETEALLINAYNAFTVEWVVQNYPLASIWRTDAPFTNARHRLGGKMVSLDEIESELRARRDPRIHAALVCAARSCPPLRREAYVPDRLDEQLDDSLREWLANTSLNRFDPSQGKAEISPIFKWYSKDFEAYPGGLEGFPRKYAPQQIVTELGDRRLEISFREYDWGLNDQSEVGESYSRLQYAIDRLRNWFRGLGGS